MALSISINVLEDRFSRGTAGAVYRRRVTKSTKELLQGAIERRFMKYSNQGVNISEVKLEQGPSVLFARRVEVG